MSAYLSPARLRMIMFHGTSTCSFLRPRIKILFSKFPLGLYYNRNENEFLRTVQLLYSRFGV